MCVCARVYKGMRREKENLSAGRPQNQSPQTPECSLSGGLRRLPRRPRRCREGCGASRAASLHLAGPGAPAQLPPLRATALAAHTQGQSPSREENRDNKRLYPDVRLPWPRDTRRGFGRPDFKEKGVVVYFLKGRKRWVKMRKLKFPWQAAGQEPNPLETRSVLWKGSAAPAQFFSKAINWKDIKASRQHNTNQRASNLHFLHTPPPSVYENYKY